MHLYIYKNRFLNFFGSTLVNRDTEKISFLLSSLFHLSIIFVAIGMPTCFQPKTINIPNIIPIEIINIDDVTNIPIEQKKSEIDEKESNKSSKQVKFSSAEQTEIVKIQPKIKEPELKERMEMIPEKNKSNVITKSKPLIKEELIKIKPENEVLPLKKIKPKIKPKPVLQEKQDTDVVIKFKQKPKTHFNISSVLKDLRKDQVQLKQENNEKTDKNISKEDIEESTSNKFTISEIDLLKQQLYACWVVPAGTKGAKDMVVKVRVWVNPDRTVSSARILDTNRMQSNPYFRTVAESALRAVLNPACSPLKLPPEKYDVWKKFIFKFELGWMLGN